MINKLNVKTERILNTPRSETILSQKCIKKEYHGWKASLIMVAKKNGGSSKTANPIKFVIRLLCYVVYILILKILNLVKMASNTSEAFWLCQKKKYLDFIINLIKD